MCIQHGASGYISPLIATSQPLLLLSPFEDRETEAEGDEVILQGHTAPKGQN